MNRPVTDEDVRVRLRLHKKPLTGIRELDTHWELGLVQIHRRQAKYRDGYGHWPLYPGFHFYKRRFDFAESGQRGWAIIFRIVEPTASPYHEWFVGWVPPEGEAEADRWVSFLNAEIEARLEGARAEQDQMTDEDHVRFMLDGGTRGMIDRLWETSDAWGFGGTLWLSKVHPAFKEGAGTDQSGRVFPLHASSRFHKQWFELPDTGARGWALWFQRGPADPALPLGNRTLCGWVPPEREAEIDQWIELLNAEIQARLRTAVASGGEDRPIDPDQHLRNSLAFFRGLGLPMPEADTMEEFMSKLEEADSPIDLRSKGPIRVGCFRELGYGDEAPSLDEARGHRSPENTAQVVAYLRGGTPLIVSPGFARDVFDGRTVSGTRSLLTDGEYAWPDVLAYYVERYAVELPAAFEEHMARRGWQPPTGVDVDRIKL